MDFRISNTGLTRLLDSSLSLSSSSVKSNGTLDPSESWRRISAAEESRSREDSGRSGDSSSVMELSELKRRVRLSDTAGIVKTVKGWRDSTCNDNEAAARHWRFYTILLN